MFTLANTTRFNCVTGGTCTALDDATKQLFAALEGATNAITSRLPLPDFGKSRLQLPIDGQLSKEDASMVVFVLQGLASINKPGPQVNTSAKPEEIAQKAGEILAHFNAVLGADAVTPPSSGVAGFFAAHKKQIIFGGAGLIVVGALWWAIRASFQARQRQVPGPHDFVAQNELDELNAD